MTGASTSTQAISLLTSRPKQGQWTVLGEMILVGWDYFPSIFPSFPLSPHPPDPSSHPATDSKRGSWLLHEATSKRTLHSLLSCAPCPPGVVTSLSLFFLSFSHTIYEFTLLLTYVFSYPIDLTNCDLSISSLSCVSSLLSPLFFSLSLSVFFFFFSRFTFLLSYVIPV